MGHLPSNREGHFTCSASRVQQAPPTGGRERCHRALSARPDLSLCRSNRFAHLHRTTWVFRFIKKKKARQGPEKQRHLLKTTQQVSGEAEWVSHGVSESPIPTNAPRLLDTIRLLDTKHLLGTEISEDTTEHKTRHSELVPESAACALLAPSAASPTRPQPETHSPEAFAFTFNQRKRKKTSQRESSGTVWLREGGREGPPGSD